MNSISYSLFKNESLLSILVLIFIVFLLCLLLKKILPPFTYKRSQVDKVEYVPASSKTTYTKKDLYWILLLTGIYAVVSLYDLGHTKMPSTTWQPSSNEQQIIFELNKTHQEYLNFSMQSTPNFNNKVFLTISYKKNVLLKVMLKKGIYIDQYLQDMCMRFLILHYTLKQERNIANHAIGERKTNVYDIKEAIAGYIDLARILYRA